jgi:hypothetical protein
MEASVRFSPVANQDLELSRSLPMVSGVNQLPRTLLSLLFVARPFPLTCFAFFLYLSS